MKRCFMLLAIALLICSNAIADTVTVTLDNVVFSDGGTATGWFTYDTVTGYNFSITVAGGDTANWPAFTFTPGGQWAQIYGANSTYFSFWGTDAANTPNTFSVYFSPFRVYNGPGLITGTARTAVSGSITVAGDLATFDQLGPNAPVPEPATGCLLGAGFAALVCRGWRRNERAGRRYRDAS